MKEKNDLKDEYRDMADFSLAYIKSVKLKDSSEIPFFVGNWYEETLILPEEYDDGAKFPDILDSFSLKERGMNTKHLTDGRIGYVPQNVLKHFRDNPEETEFYDRGFLYYHRVDQGVKSFARRENRYAEVNNVLRKNTDFREYTDFLKSLESKVVSPSDIIPNWKSSFMGMYAIPGLDNLLLNFNEAPRKGKNPCECELSLFSASPVIKNLGRPSFGRLIDLGTMHYEGMIFDKKEEKEEPIMVG